jgi:hypothetical protein
MDQNLEIVIDSCQSRPEYVYLAFVKNSYKLVSCCAM